MQRVALAPRPDWRAKVEARGLSWHTGPAGETYWDEGAYWRFTADEIDRIEAATETLYAMCLEAIDHVIAADELAEFGYDAHAIALIEHSWGRRAGQPSLYARFDLAFDGRDLKLLELNGDTPTSLVEASVIQWWWLEERFPDLDQFNSIHEKLVVAMARLGEGPLHLTCFRPHAEDEGTIDYLAACGAEAGLACQRLGLADIGWRAGDGPGRFVDLADRRITRLFKLAPWEWLLADPFGDRLAREAMSGGLQVIEPAWKMVASNKRLLVTLWRLFPGHPLLLAATDRPGDAAALGDHARKPVRGREGANVTLVRDGQAEARTDGAYGDDLFVFQQRANLARTQAGYAVLGSWIVAGQACGLGVRESDGPITSNTARFTPHLFE